VGFPFSTRKASKIGKIRAEKREKWAKIEWFCLLLSTGIVHIKLFIILSLTILALAKKSPF
jgi:hypothetical protein